MAAEWTSIWGWVAGCVLLACGARAQAQAQTEPTAVPAERPRQEGVLDRKVPLLPAPLKLSDFPGMEPNAELAGKLAQMEGFVQNAPNNLQPATEQTKVWIGRTQTALYVVFACHDHRMGELRRHLTRRENILNDDYVSVLLDPFEDRRKGVLFQMNPLGVQADAAWTDGSDQDYSYDQVWDSNAQLTPGGWMAMFTIPFQSIRFRAGAQNWGVVLFRNIPRNSEIDTWPAISANISGTLSQEATLEGIAGVTGSHSLQLNPYVLAQNVHALNTLDPMQPFFSNRTLEGTAGGEAKAIVHDTVVMDATINPDFSQVESDQPQFTVNQRYPVFFPELRPFFLENANYFSTLIDLVYTRNIVHPEFGGRVTGKLGRTNIGLLAIDDREPGETVQEGDPLYHKRAFYGVARVSRDIGKNSSVGAIYTDQELAGSWNRIGGFDFTAHVSDKWTVAGQSVVSSSKSLDGSYFAGPASKLEVTRNGHSLNLDLAYRDFAKGFLSQTGFIQTTGFRQNESHVNYQWFPKHSLIQSVGLEESGRLAFDRDGNRLYHSNTFDPFFLLPRNMVLAPLVGQNSDTLGPATYPLLVRNRNLTENFYGFVVRGAPLRQLSMNIVWLNGGNPNYNPAAGQVPSLNHQNYVQALVTLQPGHGLTIDNTYLLDRNFSAERGDFVFENQTLRTKLNYQFTRALSARVIVEYDSLLANPAETSLTRTKQVATQVLLTWLPHPGTAIYVGYNNDLQNLNHTICTQLPGSGSCDPMQPVLPRGPGYLNDGRQIFVRASYLLRF